MRRVGRWGFARRLRRACSRSPCVENYPIMGFSDVVSDTSYRHRSPNASAALDVDRRGIFDISVCLDHYLNDDSGVWVLVHQRGQQMDGGLHVAFRELGEPEDDSGGCVGVKAHRADASEGEAFGGGGFDEACFIGAR